MIGFRAGSKVFITLVTLLKCYDEPVPDTISWTVAGL